jgi:hypothetical protein
LANPSAVPVCVPKKMVTRFRPSSASASASIFTGGGRTGVGAGLADAAFPDRNHTARITSPATRAAAVAASAASGSPPAAAASSGGMTDAAHALAASSAAIARPLPPPPAARVWVGREEEETRSRTAGVGGRRR